jgi:dienelactone hydrolase
MPRAALGLLVLIAALAGCGDSSDDDGAAKAPPKPKIIHAPKVTAEAPRPEAGRRVDFRASDGKRLRGYVSRGRGGHAPGIVLVHEYQGGPNQWDEFVPVLRRAGYATLAYESRAEDQLDETVLARDVAGAVAALRRQPGVDRRRIAVVGASIGASAAAWTIGTRPALRLRAAVGLSPPESPAFINAGSAGRFHPRDLLLIADARELIDAKGIEKDGGGRGVTVRRAPIAGHGVALLPDARVRKAILRWLDERL